MFSHFLCEEERATRKQHTLTDRKGEAERRRYLLRRPTQADVKVGQLHHERVFSRAALRTRGMADAVHEPPEERQAGQGHSTFVISFMPGECRGGIYSPADMHQATVPAK